MEPAVTEMSVGGRRKFVGIIRDITERKDAQKLINEQKQSLLELSAPVLNLWEGIVLLPSVGVRDIPRVKHDDRGAAKGD